jgi:hypothetical protein
MIQETTQGSTALTHVLDHPNKGSIDGLGSLCEIIIGVRYLCDESLSQPGIPNASLQQQS